MIARPLTPTPTPARNRPSLERVAGFVKLNLGGPLPTTHSQRLALIVRAYRSERPVACGCRECTYTIHPGEWFTMGNQRDGRGKYPRCRACWPFTSAQTGGPR